jgi:hypothetical protein
VRLTEYLIVEARKNPEMNPKTSPLDELKAIAKKYKSEINTIFVTFTNIHKLGVNPQSMYNTPLGIYSYPIQYVIKKKMEVPFQQDAKFIQVFKVTDMSNVWDVTTDNQLEEMIQKLTPYIRKHSAVGNTRQLWHSIYNSIMMNTFDTEDTKTTGLAARKMLRKVGITGVVDRGKGIIHNNEKNQAVFFNTKPLQLLSVIDNTGYSFRKNAKEIKKYSDNINNLNPHEAYRFCSMKHRRIRKLEPIIAKDHTLAATYAQFIIGGRWKEQESNIAKYPESAYRYATGVIYGRFPEGESAIASNGYTAFEYAKYVIHGRFPEGENAILADAYYKRLYTNLLKQYNIQI